MATVNRTPDRPVRTPLGQRNRLSFKNQDPNYVYRVINDQGDRLEEALEGGYEFVIEDAKLGDARAAEGGKIDSRVSKPVGNGIRGYLMRIRRDLYESDQAVKMGKIAEIEKALKPDPKKGEYGEGLTNT